MERKRPPKPLGFRYHCTACGPLEAGKPHKSWICRLVNRNEIVGADDEMIFDEASWRWVYENSKSDPSVQGSTPA